MHGRKVFEEEQKKRNGKLEVACGALSRLDEAGFGKKNNARSQTSGKKKLERLMVKWENIY